MSRIGLGGFEDKFRADPDPWRTFTDADEAAKRTAILRALGPGRHGRIWEPASGAGANSAALAARALRLDATEGAPSAVALTVRALEGRPRASASRLVLPGRPPRSMYDAIVVAEVLYYLTPTAMRRFAHVAARSLRTGGRLVLAHHQRDFYDFSQPARGIHERFLRATGAQWRPAGGTFTRSWRVRAFDKVASDPSKARRPVPAAAL